MSAQQKRDEQFREWISRQPSCISNTYGEYLDSGEGRNIACHVRRVSKGAGVGTKPLFFCVPMTHEEHMNTHRFGERYYHTPQWFEKRAEEYFQRWERECGA